MDKRSGPSPCPKCDETVGRKYDLDRHDRSLHLDDTVFFCDQDGCPHARRDSSVKTTSLSIFVASTSGTQAATPSTR